MKLIYLLAATAATIAACAPAAPTHDSAADMAAISKVRNDFMAAFKAGDAAKMATLYDANAMSMGNGQPTAIGPAGVETMNKGMMSQMASQEITIKPEKTEISGDVAYEHGTYSMMVTPKGGAMQMEDGRYLVVLKRQADGSWKLVEEMGNLPTAPAPAAPPAMMMKKKP